MTERARFGTWLVFIVVFVLASAGVARADGDPASDILYTQRLYVPFDTRISKGAQDALTTALAEAERAGYPIRVAVIEKPSDLGAVTILWQKPKQYARFLGLELGIAYKGQLLVVMPSGLGFAHVTRTANPERTHDRSTAAEYRTLAAVPVQPGADGLAYTATRAVERLAQRAGHPIAPPVLAPEPNSSFVSRKVAGGAIVLVLVASAIGAYAVFRRRRLRA